MMRTVHFPETSPMQTTRPARAAIAPDRPPASPKHYLWSPFALADAQRELNILRGLLRDIVERPSERHGSIEAALTHANTLTDKITQLRDQAAQSEPAK
jgi:hypothetical protein